ncbi:MAG: hypothetical protein LBK13_09640 [Spirochaetales bacterium]|jgi:hypothetical protein|nr:hypothetical protein [Spirochaetales bacterium]
MVNDINQKYYSFFIHFNPFLRSTAWDKTAERAQKYYTSFLNEDDYGDLISMTFNFFIEEKADIDKQNDYVSVSTYMGIPPGARLNVHIDYEYFINSPDEIKYKTAVNGILFLLNYWKDNYKIPKNNELEKLIINYQNRLQADNLFDGNLKNTFIKINNPFRFNFMKHFFYGIKEKEILFDTNDIEKYLNNNLYKNNFGESINKLFFSYDIFDFENQGHKQYIDNEKKYSYGKNKDLCIMEQYNSRFFKDKTKYEQIKYLHTGMMEAIERIKDMKRKPKDFNVEGFYETLDKLMNGYENSIK